MNLKIVLFCIVLFTALVPLYVWYAEKKKLYTSVISQRVIFTKICYYIVGIATGILLSIVYNIK